MIITNAKQQHYITGKLMFCRPINGMAKTKCFWSACLHTWNQQVRRPCVVLPSVLWDSLNPNGQATRPSEGNLLRQLLRPPGEEFLRAESLLVVGLFAAYHHLSAIDRSLNFLKSWVISQHQPEVPWSHDTPFSWADEFRMQWPRFLARQMLYSNYQFLELT